MNLTFEVAYYVTKNTWLARDIIIYSGAMFSRVLYYIMNFDIIAVFWSVICYHTAALRCKRVVNKHNYYVSACNILYFIITSGELDIIAMDK